MLYIILLRGRFCGLLSAPVAFRGVGRKRDSCSFGSMLGETPDWVCCVSDLEPVDLMPSVPTWRLRWLRFPTWGVGWLLVLACSGHSGMLNG